MTSPIAKAFGRQAHNNSSRTETSFFAMPFSFLIRGSMTVRLPKQRISYPFSFYAQGTRPFVSQCQSLFGIYRPLPKTARSHISRCLCVCLFEAHSKRQTQGRLRVSGAGRSDSWPVGAEL